MGTLNVGGANLSSLDRFNPISEPRAMVLGMGRQN